MNEFTEYNNGLKEQKKQSDKINYIMSTDYDSDTKEKMIKDATKKDVDVDKFNSYEEFDYATKHEKKYDIGTSIMDFNEFYSIDNNITKLKANTSKDKEATFNYINKLNVSNVNKGILKKMYYKSYKSQDKEIINYINNMRTTKAKKEKLFTDLGFTVKNGYVYS